MKRLRILTVAFATALFVSLGLAVPAQATHKCAEPDIEDDQGIGETVVIVCDYGPHEPVGVIQYVLCWLSPTC